MATYILSLDFVENAKLMNYKSLGISRMNAWRLLSRPEFCDSPIMDYVKMLWENKEELLMAYFKTVETEWRNRHYKSNLPLEAFENHNDYEIPEEWKNRLFIDSHRLMHNRLYKAYSIMDLELSTDIDQVLLNPYKLAEGIRESPKLPEFLENPRYCRYTRWSENQICEEGDFPSGRCSILLKSGQEFCKYHNYVMNESKKCSHMRKDGCMCHLRCKLDQVFCTTHKKYVEDTGENICAFVSEHGECIRHAFDNSEFCRLHGGKPKKSTKSNKTPINKKRKVSSKGKEPLDESEASETDERPMRAEYIPPSATVEKFELRGYEITKFQETNDEIKVVYRKLK